MDEHLIGKTGAAVTALGFGGAPAGNLYQETTDEATTSGRRHSPTRLPISSPTGTTSPTR